MKSSYNIYNTVPILEVRHLSKRFGKKEALRDINFRASHGEVISIIGPSGAGKSTLIRCINGLQKPTSGEVLHNGYNIISKNRRVNDYNAKVGMVFQNFNLFNNMTILENCMIGVLNVFKRDREEASKLAVKYLKKVGMDSYINIRPNLLSDGQKQRIAIARALIMEPEILLFDDPTGELDISMTGEVLEVISKLAKEGRTMIIVTNDIDFAIEVSSHVVFMDNGIIVEEGSPEGILNRPKKNSTENFLKNIEVIKNSNILINY